MKKSTICCWMLLAAPAFAGDPHLSGTWVGTAEHQICGQPASSREITLILHDAGNSPHLAGAEDINGDLTVGSAASVPVTLGYDAKTARVTGSPTSAFSFFEQPSGPAYQLQFQAGEAWAGVGYYQSLTGTVSQFNAYCADRGNRGEVLTVTLKKQ
jgi:hypothetical protein